LLETSRGGNGKLCQNGGLGLDTPHSRLISKKPLGNQKGERTYRRREVEDLQEGRGSLVDTGTEMPKRGTVFGGNRGSASVQSWRGEILKSDRHQNANEKVEDMLEGPSIAEYLSGYPWAVECLRKRRSRDRLAEYGGVPGGRGKGGTDVIAM